MTSKRPAKNQPKFKQQTAAERNKQLSQILDNLLYRIQYGCGAERERTELFRQYEILDRILQRNGGIEDEKNDPIYKLLHRLDEEAGLV